MFRKKIEYDKKELIQQDRKGLNDTQLAEYFGVSRTLINRWRKAAGLPPRRLVVRYHPEIEAEFNQLYLQGFTDTEIGRECGYAAQAVASWRQRMGYKDNRHYAKTPVKIACRIDENGTVHVDPKYAGLGYMLMMIEK